MSGSQYRSLRHIRCLRCGHTIVKTKSTSTTKLTEPFFTDASLDTQNGSFACGFALPEPKTSLVQVENFTCAAGLKCVMCKNGIVPIAPSTHRCPGTLQNFQSCNKPIHAICGVTIQNPTNGDMFNKWCYDCANTVQQQKVPDQHIESTIKETILGADTTDTTCVVPNVQGVTLNPVVVCGTKHSGLPTLSEPTMIAIQPTVHSLPPVGTNVGGNTLSSRQPTTSVLNNAIVSQTNALPPVTFTKLSNPYKTKDTPQASFRQRANKFGSSRKTQTRIKQFHVFFTMPVPQAQTTPSQYAFKFAVFLRAHTNMTKDNTVIEFKPEIFIMMCDLVYSTRNTPSEIRLGTMNDYTDMITSSFAETYRIRAHPGEEDDTYKTSGNGNYYAEQVGGLFEVTVQRPDFLQQEMDNILQEFKNIVTCQGFFHAYKYAAYWKYCNEPGTPIETLTENVNRELTLVGNRDQIFNKAKPTGRLYQILIQDQHETLRKVLGSTEMVVKHNVSLDEVLQNADIAEYARGLIGIYSAPYRRVLFLKDVPNRDLAFLNTGTD